MSSDEISPEIERSPDSFSEILSSLSVWVLQKSPSQHDHVRSIPVTDTATNVGAGDTVMTSVISA